MNWDQLEGQWKQMGAKVKSKWAKLTDDDLLNLGAKKDELVAKLQERYGILKDEAERQVDEWMTKLSPKQDSQQDSGQKAAKDAGTNHSKRA
jgi:uncharacterized protein YjbJ (UPF0337 family)